MGWKGTRREMLKLAGGSALGLILTPVPWKLLGDSAVWTQNWAAIARLPRGEITFRQTACALCPAGCGLTARCVAGTPVSLSGVAADPASRGALCPIGLAGHQLPWHPARARGPRRRADHRAGRRAARRPATDPAERTTGGGWTDVTPDAAVALTAAALRDCRGGRIALVLDDRPGRAVSDVYRAFAAAVPAGACVVSPAREARSLEMLASLDGEETARPAVLSPLDARVLLSFGAPLLDGFGGPGLSAALLTARRADGLPWIAVAEPGLSRTASLADLWLPIRPGSEAVLALGIAHVLLQDAAIAGPARARATDCERYAALVSRFDPESVARRTDVKPDVIVEVARRLAGAPSLVVGTDLSSGVVTPEEEMAVQGLNRLLAAGRGDGLAGRGDGLIRRPAPLPWDATSPAVPDRALEEIPDGSVRLLIMDATDGGGGLAWTALEPKLAPEGCLVVSFSPWPIGLSRHADLVVPAASNLETFDELTGPPVIAPLNYRLAPPLLDPPQGRLEPIDFLRQIAIAAGRPLAGEAGSAALVDLLKARAGLLHAAGRGQIVTLPDGGAAPVSSLATSDELWEALQKGGVWIDDSAPTPPSGPFRLLGAQPEKVERVLSEALGGTAATVSGSGPTLVAVASGWNGSRGAGSMVPLLSKLGRESRLRETGSEVFVNPATARALGLTPGKRVEVTTRQGVVKGILRVTPGVRLGVIRLAEGPPEAAAGHSEWPAPPEPAATPAEAAAGTNGAMRAMAARIREV